MEDSTRHTILTCTLGYALILASSVAATLGVKAVTGWYPSFRFFTLALVTFRLWEVNAAFILGPLLASLITMSRLSRTPVDVRVAGGLSMASYYALAALGFLAAGAGEFPLIGAALWIPWVFILGAISSIAAERKCER